MRKILFAAALAACVSGGASACDGPRFPRLAKLFAAKPASSCTCASCDCGRPAAKAAAAVVQTPVRVVRMFAAPVKATCANGNCR